jgi:hypothetical protein
MEETWEIIYDDKDGYFKSQRETQPVLINPMIGQVLYQFGKLYFIYKIELAKKTMRLKEINPAD